VPNALRIAFFVPSFPEVSETFILRQVVGLLDRGHDVRIFAYAEPSEGPVHDAADAHDLWGRVRVLSGPDRSSAAGPPGPDRGGPRARSVALASLTVLGGFRPRYARALGGWPAMARTLVALGRERPFDVVHCHYGNVGLHYRAAARVWHAPLVTSFYGYDCSSYPRERGACVFEPLFADADAITVLSAHMEEQLRRLGCPPSLLRRIPLAVDPSFCAPEPQTPRHPSDTVRLLTVARLTEKKGIEFALRALALVRGEFPHVRYDVIGAGPLSLELEALAGTLGLEDRVSFLGARTSEYVRDAMRAADLFVLPSVRAANGDEEGTPTVLLEAACCRLPVLATVHAGIPEIVRDGESGYLVRERDVEGLADGLRSLLRSPERWAAMGEAGLRLVEPSHTTPAVAARLEALYREVRS
jgi:colanic acid/amylovoran biosynthesis glycosyltransferase